MAFMDWFRRKPTAAEEVLRALSPPVYEYPNQRRGIHSGKNQPATHALLTDGFKSVQATSARAVANRLSEIPFEVEEKGTDDLGQVTWEANPDHALQEVLEYPNVLLTRRQLVKATSFWLSQTGEAFWLIVTNGAGMPVELWPLSPDRTEKVSDGALPVSSFVFHSTTGEVNYSLEEVIWFHEPDPANVFEGLGVLGPQALDYDSLQFANETVKSHYQNDAVPKTVMKATAESVPPNAEERDAFYADWMNRFNRRKGENTGAPAFIPSGFDMQELSGMSDISGMVELLSYQRDNLLASMGIPKAIIGEVADANRANADAALLTFDRHTIKPWAGLVSDCLTAQLARPVYGPDVRVGFTDFVSKDEDLRLREEAQDLTLKVRSIDQVREDRGLPGVDWGELPVGTFGDQPYTGDEEPEPMAPPVTDPVTPEIEEDAPDEDEEVAADASRSVSRGTVHLHTDPDLVWYEGIATEAMYYPRMLKAVRAGFGAQKAYAIEWVRERGERYGIERADLIGDLFDDPQMNQLFYAQIAPVRSGALVTAAENAIRGVGVDVALLSFQEAAIARVNEETAFLVEQLGKTTASRVQRAVAEGIASGAPRREIEKAIRGEFNSMSRSRARTIARTEVGTAVEHGHLVGYEASEVVEGVQWNTARDERVRDSHKLDGVRVKLGETFTLATRNGSEEAKAPRTAADGGRLSPENHINCRCFSTAVVIGGS